MIRGKIDGLEEEFHVGNPRYSADPSELGQQRTRWMVPLVNNTYKTAKAATMEICNHLMYA